MDSNAPMEVDKSKGVTEPFIGLTRLWKCVEKPEVTLLKTVDWDTP
jgi:hypothetical protein